MHYCGVCSASVLCAWAQVTWPGAQLGSEQDWQPVQLVSPPRSSWGRLTQATLVEVPLTLGWGYSGSQYFEGWCFQHGLLDISVGEQQNHDLGGMREDEGYCLLEIHRKGKQVTGPCLTWPDALWLVAETVEAWRGRISGQVTSQTLLQVNMKLGNPPQDDLLPTWKLRGLGGLLDHHYYGWLPFLEEVCTIVWHQSRWQSEVCWGAHP